MPRPLRRPLSLRLFPLNFFEDPLARLAIGNLGSVHNARAVLPIHHDTIHQHKHRQRKVQIQQ